MPLKVIDPLFIGAKTGAKKVVGQIYPVVPILLIILFFILFISVLKTSIFGAVEEEKHIFFEITFLLLLAVLAEFIVLYLKQPTVIILLLLGMVMSTSFLQFLWPYIPDFELFGRSLPHEPPDILKNLEVIQVFAQLGAIILLFKVGLHNKIGVVFSKVNIVVAVLGVVFPFIVGYIYADYTSTNGSFIYPLFMGAALTATSVGVTVAILKDLNMLQKNFANIIIGAAVIDDILALLVLSFVLNVPEAITPEALLPMLSVVFSAIIFIGGGILAGKLWVNKVIDVLPLNNQNFLLIMIFLLTYAYVAEFIGLSSIVGAFFAGVLLNYSKHIKEIEDKFYALDLLFTPIFFISLGLLIDIGAVIEFLVPIMVLTIIAIITKVISCGFGSLAFGINRLESAIIGFGMTPRGEVALIIGLFGLSKGVLSVSEYSIISAMALLTTIIGPAIFGYLIKKVR